MLKNIKTATPSGVAVFCTPNHYTFIIAQVGADGGSRTHMPCGVRS